MSADQSDTSYLWHGQQVLDCAPDGPTLDVGNPLTDLIGAAFGHQADLVVVPVSRLAGTFFDLRSGVAGEIVQKFVNYRLRLAVVGDISAHLATSTALRAFVREANRGRQLWFVTDHSELDKRLTP
ncbi:uncharacterized protein DUF4180 [Micromonospora pisi]|uniref:Uncharacterized protein DUF4180 n=1 Tax=Micromonospora pisi TaxID=589240 RepID=A0A495JEG1_9ACTN|nr:DUF4180 domain-containing protein [Micromonospora pisi]RKR86764.1 uncharacterized protein DUF4180 [Micromonospora pisi]